jgi:hypothetical protein
MVVIEFLVQTGRLGVEKRRFWDPAAQPNSYGIYDKLFSKNDSKIYLIQ